MDDRPSFRRRNDVLRFIGTVFLPWSLAVIASAPVQVYWVLADAGWQNAWFTWAVAWWYWAGCLAAVLTAGGVYLFICAQSVWVCLRGKWLSLYDWALVLSTAASILALCSVLGD